MHDTEGETIEDVRRQRDELGIQLAALRERLRLAMSGSDAKALVDRADEMEALAERWEDRYCSQTIRADEALLERDAAIAAQDALGIQLAALRERLRLAMVVIDKVRFHRTCRCGHIACNRCRDDRFSADALAALDAVPGDTLERP
jgi:hypothetical protein